MPILTTTQRAEIRGDLAEIRRLANSLRNRKELGYWDGLLHLHQINESINLAREEFKTWGKKPKGNGE